MSICDKLATLAQNHQTLAQPDALLAFLTTHLCICRAINRRPEASVRKLNDCFVGVCLDIYEDWKALRPEHLSLNWRLCLIAYKKEAHAVARLLPRMAFIHIQEDLPVALYECCDCVSKSEFDILFDDIVCCVSRTQTDYKIRKNLTAEFAAAFRPLAIKRIFWATILFVAWIPICLKCGIKIIRRGAWRKAQKAKMAMRNPLRPLPSSSDLAAPRNPRL